ncbi:MAG: hypothetical protein ACI854_002516 [Arenicella sp.]|jgi:hypothetical protein
MGKTDTSKTIDGITSFRNQSHIALSITSKAQALVGWNCNYEAQLLFLLDVKA